jgi:uracil phosphoribosyltransferase
MLKNKPRRMNFDAICKSRRLCCSAKAGQNWEIDTIEVETPLKNCDGAILAKPIVLVPILRAGLGFLEGMLRMPEAGIGRIGLYRDEEALRPGQLFLPVGGESRASRSPFARSHACDR